MSCLCCDRSLNDNGTELFQISEVDVILQNEYILNIMILFRNTKNLVITLYTVKVLLFTYLSFFYALAV